MSIIYITVCKNIILSNIKYKTNKPAIRVSVGKYGPPKRYHEYTTTGKVRVVTDMKNPLPWGARVWLEETKT